MGRRQRPHGTGSLFKRENRGPWIGRWYDHLGRRREQSTGTTDKAAAERILGKRVADAALRRDRVVDPRSDRYIEANRRPLPAHVGEWIKALTAKGITDRQTALLRQRVDAILGAIGAERIGELAASDVQAAIGELHRH